MSWIRDEVCLALRELGRSEKAAGLLALGVALLCGSGFQVASAVRQEVAVAMERLRAVRCSEVLVEVQAKRPTDLSTVRLHWQVTSGADAGCTEPEWSLTVELPERAYRLEVPVGRRAMRGKRMCGASARRTA